nr:MAG TPA: Phosphodiester glycosidase [Caudoviricetes sp.]DAX85568.1 MAG TPA: Phosphodiester glycosidase [Caudoviricetes sp.]
MTRTATSSRLLACAMVDTFDCARAQIYHNTQRLTPAQIKAKTGCTHIINGYLFNGRFVPVGWCVIEGKVISRDKYQDWGVSIGSDGKPQMLTDRGGSFLSGVPILKAGSKLYRGLTADVARPAARTAVGWMPNGKVCLWCDKTSLTREQLQNKLLGLGVVDALMLDGGGSTQGIFPKGKVTSTRKVPTLLLFWERSAKVEDQALVWGEAHGLLTDANAGETVTRADMVRALYQIWEDNHG